MSSERVTERHLEQAVKSLKRIRPDIDWQLDGAYGGHQLCLDQGQPAFSHGHRPKRELLSLIHAFQAGLSLAHYERPIDPELLDMIQTMQGKVFHYDDDEQGVLVTFTVERAKGETYAHGEPTVYAHWEETSGVLSGTTTRAYLGPVPQCCISMLRCIADSFENTAESFRRALPDHLRERTETIEGTTHVPVDQVVAHLPDEDDMPGGPGLDDLPDLGWEDRHGAP